MDIFSFTYEEFERFLFVFFRVAAFIIFVPILGSRQFPARVKIGFIFLLSLSVYPLIQKIDLAVPMNMWELSIRLISESFVGLAIAFVTRLVFTAVQVAGTLVDFQMGFGVVNVIDPQTESQVSITAQFQNIFAILLYLVLNAHHITIYALVESFQMINPQQISFSENSIGLILQLFKATFVVSVKIAAPIMAILFFISVGLGLIARAVPQMNVFIVGFPLQIGLGLVTIGLTMTLFSMIFKHQVSQLPFWLNGLMRTM